MKQYAIANSVREGVAASHASSPSGSQFQSHLLQNFSHLKVLLRVSNSVDDNGGQLVPPRRYGSLSRCALVTQQRRQRAAEPQLSRDKAELWRHGPRGV